MPVKKSKTYNKNFTGRRKLEEYNKLLTDVLLDLNKSEYQLDIIRNILKIIKQYTGVEAVGIRLKEGEDFPYFYHSGFSDSFIEKEMSLCAKNQKGEPIRDSKGGPYLECMCGDVLCGRTDPSKSFFTKGGSFWSNCTTDILVSPNEKDRWVCARERCNSEGYESVALVPLRSSDEIIGLLQINDRRRDCFTFDFINFLEGLGSSIGIALKRKKIEDEIKESKNFTDIVFESIMDLVSVIDAKTFEILKTNRALIDSLKIEDKNIIGRKCYEVTHQNDKPCGPPEHICPMYETLKTGTASTVEHIHYDKGGNKIYFEVSTSPIKNEKGEIVQVVHVARNITERKKVKEMLQVSENRFRGTFEQAAVGIAHVALDGKWILVNQRFCDIIGYSREEIANKKFQDITYPDDLDRDVGYVKEMLENKRKTFSMEKRYIRKDGLFVWVNLTVSLMRKPSGEPDYFISVVEDISERKKGEQWIKQSYEKLRKALEQTSHALSITVEQKDPYTAGHQHRVSKLACAIARELGFDDERVTEIRIAGDLHDLGKISIPSEILTKPGKLSEIEMDLVKNHSQTGYEILKEIDFPWPIAEITLQHHERINGSGYPNGLKGEAIKIEAKIIGVADVVEAMSSHRPYRPALGINNALEEILQKRDILYDSRVVDACLKLFIEKGFKFE
ncbi:MAG: PAS domain S-box protein [bacterium]